MKQFLTSPQYRLPLYLAIGALLLAFLLYGELGRSYRSAKEAAENERVCRNLAERILELKKKPELIFGSMSSTAQIAQSVEAAMAAAEIPAAQLVRIEPRSAKRFEKTPFMEQPSHLELREVTLEQIIRFLHTLSVQNRLEVQDLRLHAPRASEAEGGVEKWNVELVLTNTIYSP